MIHLPVLTLIFLINCGVTNANLVSDDFLLRVLLRTGLERAAARNLQPGGGGGGGVTTPGAVAASSCGSGTCTTSGGGNYMTRNLILDTSTGIFSGSLTTNACPNHAGAYQYGGIKDAKINAATATCQTWTLPVNAYTTFPKASPLRGAIGYTISGGEVIYGPMDAGFTTGQVCTTAIGTCPLGTDTRFCGALLEKACGTAGLKGSTTVTAHMLLSDCGGHAGYHNHEGLTCEYSVTAAGHSPLVAILLDGRGLYGQYESTGTKPTNLDACNGHTSATPATTVGSNTYAATTSTYHYHMTTEAPFTAGCFGPVTSLAQAKALYTSCNSGGATCTCSQSTTCVCASGQVMQNTCTSLGSVTSYTLDCPVYSMGSLAIINVNDAGCVPCVGSCPAGGSTTIITGTTATATLSVGSSPSPSPSPTPSAPAMLSSAASSSVTSPNVGLIVGVVLGIAAVLCGIIVIYFYLRYSAATVKNGITSKIPIASSIPSTKITASASGSHV